jgi:hypothetical protein
MKTENLMMVRVYLTEHEHRARELLEYLRDSGIRGATLLRGVSGFGQSGKWHQADWADLVGDLPLILEFADSPARVDAVLPGLLAQTKPRHVLRFPLEALLPD